MTHGEAPTSSERISRGRTARFRGDQLAVVLPHVELVTGQLAQWDAAPVVVDHDDRLGLALLGLDADAALRRLPGSDVPSVADEAPAPLDLVLRGLRETFARRYAGWSPTVGKNRILEHVTGSYVIDGGGATAGPVPAYVIDGGGDGCPAQTTTGPQEPVPLRALEPGRGIRIGLVDTRLDPHPWLAGGYVAAARDVRRPGDRVGPAGDHATFVAGLVLRQAPGAVVVLHRGLSDEGTTDSWSLARTVADLADAGTQIINLSLGCYTDDGRPPLVLSAALAALGPDAVIVAAAGNHGSPDAVTAPFWPAALDQVVSVGALDGDGPAAFSPDAPWVDVLAPGVDVVSTYDAAHDGSGGFGRWTGTSFAAAVVSGEVAARTGQRTTAQQAWAELRRTVKRDDSGRPVVGLRQVPGWPADGDRTGTVAGAS